MAILILSLLTGCGFQLRGSVALPDAMARTAITGINERDPLAIDLRRALIANGVEVVDVSRATAELRFDSVNSGRRVVSVGADARVFEFEVYLRITYRVQGVDSEFELEPTTLNLGREYLFDRDNVLSQMDQERSLRESMRRDAVQLIMLRLQSGDQ